MHRFTDHPYTVTSAVFLGVFLFGTLFLDWGRMDYAFGLLLFLIVVIGIRLDDMAKAIGSTRPERSASREADQDILSAVKEMQTEIKRIRIRLEALNERLDRNHLQ